MSLKVKYSSIKNVRMESIASILKDEFQNTISNANWSEFPYQPQVTFSILHNNDDLFIRFKVIEQEVRAVNTKDHQNIWEDSCVEFFVSDDKGGYFNFEFNAKGICVAAQGKGRSNREALSPLQMNQIQRLSSNIEKVEDGMYSWNLTVAIPLSIIGHPNEDRYKANFYKCGDELKVPHFLSWKPIAHPTPDFHRPEFFGEMVLEAYTA